MNTVTVVPNKKTGKLYAPTTNGKWWRIQVSSTGYQLRNGFEQQVKLTGFYYVGTEDRAKEIVASAHANGMQLPGKIVYKDQLMPINEEAPEYGMQFPYPFRYNGGELSLEQRLAIQAACVEKGMPLMQSGKAIYRRKYYTSDMSEVSSILSPDNQDDINAFIGKLLGGTVNGAPVTDAAAIKAQREKRMEELKAIPKTKRTAEEKAELAELLED